jgi:delta 1-pyrroline-5-carboxylate dehydrogenase
MAFHQNHLRAGVHKCGAQELQRLDHSRQQNAADDAAKAAKVAAEKIKYTDLFIDGRYQKSARRETYEVLNPATDAVIANVVLASPIECGLAIKAARDTFDGIGKSGYWRSTTPSYRRKLITKLANLLERDRETLESLETLDTGTSFKKHWEMKMDGPQLIEDMSDVAQAISILRQFASKTMVGYTVRDSDDCHIMSTHFEPVGVIAAITHFKRPISTLMSILSPALLARNTLVVKVGTYMIYVDAFIAKLINSSIPIPVGKRRRPVGESSGGCSHLRGGLSSWSCQHPRRSGHCRWSGDCSTPKCR